MTNAQFRILLIIIAMVIAFVYTAVKKSECDRIQYNLEFHSEIKEAYNEI